MKFVRYWMGLRNYRVYKISGRYFWHAIQDL
jgi:hypothetical protein